MATQIRLHRIAAKKAQFQRMAVADARSPRDSPLIEEIGYYYLIQEPAEIKIYVE